MKPQTRAVIIAQRRSGSTMLCYALSNHADVHCTRGEPLHRLNAWRWAFGGAETPWGREVYKRIIGLALNLWGYKACVTKVNWGPGTEEVWDWLATVDPPIQGIYLKRENHLRQAVSEMIRVRTKAVGQPRDHTEERLPVFRLTIHPDELLQLMMALEDDDWRATDVLHSRGIPYLSLTYCDLVGEEGRDVATFCSKASDALCDWLRVWRIPVMSVLPLRRMNPYPLADIIENWGEVREVVNASGRWAWCLEDEGRWN